MRATLAALATLAAISLVVPARAEGVAPRDATAAQRERAQEAFTRGRDFFAEGRFSEAEAAFRASVSEVASPNARLYLARAARERGDLAGAYRELSRVVDEADAAGSEYARAAEAAREERRELEPKLAFVTVVADGASEVEVGGARGAAGAAHAATPGRVTIAAQSASGLSRSVEVDLTAGERRTVTLALAPDTPPAHAPDPSVTAGAETRAAPSPLRPWAYVAGGVGVAGLATFGVFGALSQGTHGDLERACGADPCPADRAGEIARGRAQQTIANVGLVIGVVGVAAGVTLFVLSFPKRTATARLAVAPAGLALDGVF